MDIRIDRQKGLNYVELGKKYHMDPRTAKRYAQSPQKPEYTESAKTNEDGPIQAACGRVVGGGTVLSNTDFGKAAGDRIRRRVQYREGVCEQPENGPGRESDSAVRDNAWEAGADGLVFLRTTRCTRMGNGRSCTAFL